MVIRLTCASSGTWGGHRSKMANVSQRNRVPRPRRDCACQTGAGEPPFCAAPQDSECGPAGAPLECRPRPRSPMTAMPPPAIHKSMTATEWGLLVLLATLWGGSYFYIGVAVQALPPLFIVAFRVTLGAALLYLVVRLSGQRMPTERGDLGRLLRHGPHQQRHPLQPDLVGAGPRAERLRRHPQRDDADLRGDPRQRHDRRREDDARPPRSAWSSASSASR